MLTIFEILFFGILLGWGAAIPVGPITLEIIRRNLKFGTPVGLFFGFGACTADLLYLVLLSVGALSLLTHPLILKIVGFIGALVLIYFGVSALRAKPSEKTGIAIGNASLFKQYCAGLLLTLSNPMTILFWASISSQVVILSTKHPFAVVFAGLGVIFGTISWVITVNLFTHITKHKISDKTINILNKIGGIILLGFAAFSLYYSVTS